mgnify:CR=1 FL=1
MKYRFCWSGKQSWDAQNRELFEEREVFSIAFIGQLLGRYKSQRGRINAVAQSSGCRAVLEYVSEVRVGKFAADFNAGRKERVVVAFNNVFGFDWLCETGPACAGLKFVVGTEKGFAGDDIDVDARGFIIPISVAKRTLGSVLLGDLILQFGELLPQIGCSGLSVFFFGYGHRQILVPN